MANAYEKKIARANISQKYCHCTNANLMSLRKRNDLTFVLLLKLQRWFNKCFHIMCALLDVKTVLFFFKWYT